MLQAFERGDFEEQAKGQRKTLPWQTQTAFIAKTGGSAITGRSGIDVSSATVTVYRINDDDELEETDLEKTAWNLSTEEVAANAYIVITLECSTNKWIVTWEDCA